MAHFTWKFLRCNFFALFLSQKAIFYNNINNLTKVKFIKSSS